MHEDDSSEIIGLLQEIKDYSKAISTGVFIIATSAVIALLRFW